MALDSDLDYEVARTLAQMSNRFGEEELLSAASTGIRPNVPRTRETEPTEDLAAERLRSFTVMDHMVDEYGTASRLGEIRTPCGMLHKRKINI